MAPSHRNWEDVWSNLMGCIPFLYETLQALKLTKLEMMLVEVGGEPELEGEMIVGPRGEALRPLGKEALLI